MDIDQRTQQVNSFNGGMNSDISDSLIGSDKYRLANNLRYITNIKENTGELHQIDGSTEIHTFGDKILATTQIRDYGIIVFQYTNTVENTTLLNGKYYDIYGYDVTEFVENYPNPCMYIARFTNPYSKQLITTDHTIKMLNAGDPKIIFGPCDITDYLNIINTNPHKLSLVTRWEDDDNAKLYIADSIHPVMILNIFKYNGNKFEDISSYPQVSLIKPCFCGLVSGQLKAGLVQYSYQLYSRKGRQTEISPTTKLIPIINNLSSTSSSAKQIVGLEEGYQSNSGVSLDIYIPKKYSNLNNILIYRIYYQENGQNPSVDVIYDGAYTEETEYTQSIATSTDDITFSFIDVGQSSKQSVTLEEYNSLSGIHIIPRIIESKNDYLFAANIKEETSNITGFEDWDARSFQFDLNGDTHLFNYSSGSLYANSPLILGDIKAIEDKTSSSYDKDFYKFDCYNKFNDMSMSVHDYLSSDSPQLIKGVYDRFTDDAKYYGGTGINISWKFVVTKLVADTSLGEYDNSLLIDPTTGLTDSTGRYGTAHNTTSFNDSVKFSSYNLDVYYITKDGDLEHKKDTSGKNVSVNISDLVDSSVYSGPRNYSNPQVSYALKSLRRDELYRYGIVMYDKFGHGSPVKWIADIRVPNIYMRGFQSFQCKDLTDGTNPYDLTVRPIGIEFEVKNLPDECVYYEIVRCNRTASDISTITQGVISRPVKKVFNKYYTGTTTSPYTPTGFLTTARWWTGTYPRARWYNTTTETEDGGEADNYDNTNIFQFVSPEIVYAKDTSFSELKDKKLSISSQVYLFGAIGYNGYVHNNDYFTYNLWLYTQNTELNMVTIHPAISNANLNLNHRESQFYDKNSSGSVVTFDYDSSREIYKNPIASKCAIMQLGNLTKQQYYRTICANQLTREINNGAGEDGGNSCSVPSLNKIILRDNTGTISESSQVFKDTDNFSNVAKQSYSYIKLYNQSSEVAMRGHYKGEPSRDIYFSGDSEFNADGTASSANIRGFYTKIHSSYNSCGILDIQLASELGWDDLSQSTTTNNETTYSLKYKDNITAIGGYNFCNWVCGGAYDVNVTKMIRKNTNYSAFEDSSQTPQNAGNQILGPAGRCLLLNIDNQWEVNTNNDDDSANVENLPQTHRESFMFSDTIGAYSVMSCGKNEYVKGASTDYDKLYNGSAIQQDIFSHFIRNSIAGTYLCNIRQSVIPYNGYDYVSRSSNTYYGYGDIFFKNTSFEDDLVYVFDGDCFIVPMEYVSMHKYYNNVQINAANNTVIYSIPVETSMNLCYSYGNEFSMHMNDNGIENLQIKASNVYNLYTQKTPLYQYNTAYNSNAKSTIFSAYDKLNYEQQKSQIDYRCRYSGQKTNNEIYDNWLKFQSANYLDLDTRKGSITNLRTFNNNLIYFQQQGVGVFSVNERTTITDESNMPLILGTGGVLSRYDYLTTSNGMNDNEYNDTQSENSLYWWDRNKREICVLSSDRQINVLSKVKQVQNFINKQFEASLISDTPQLSYDKQYSEVICNVSNGTNYEDGSLIYSELTQAFNGTYTINQTSDIQFYNRLYLTDDKSLYEWNVKEDDKCRSGFNDILLMPYVKYVVNDNSQYVKVFDNEYFGGKFGDNNTYHLNFKFKTPLGQSSSITGDTVPKEITNREYDFRFAIPRNNGDSYGGRMRGKTMQCEMIGRNSEETFSLQYIITKYRMSWS